LGPQVAPLQPNFVITQGIYPNQWIVFLVQVTRTPNLGRGDFSRFTDFCLHILEIGEKSEHAKFMLIAGRRAYL
jgi:hypothetical protein